MRCAINLVVIVFSFLSIVSCESIGGESSINGTWVVKGYWDYPGHCPAQNSWKDDGRTTFEFNSGEVSVGSSKGSYSLKDKTMNVNIYGERRSCELFKQGDDLSVVFSVYPHSATSGVSSCRHTYKLLLSRAKGSGGGSVVDSKDFASSSVSGKTVYIDGQNVKVSISGSSCSTHFINSSYTSGMSGSPSFSYSKTEKNRASFYLSYTTKPTLAGVASYNSRLSLVLTFTDQDGGIYSGTNSYSFSGSFVDSGSSEIKGMFRIK